MAQHEHRRDDPYDVLGVRASASMQDIVRAYRRAALAAHPDAQPADPGAAGRFSAITEAYHLLRDPGRRAEYDRSRSGKQKLTPDVPRSRSPQGPATTRPQPALWAGPVHIQPSPQRAGRQDWPQPEGPAEPLDLLEWYLHRIWGWPS